MTASTTLTYRVPLPPKGSGSNARGRWTRSRAAKQYREECAEAYRDQGVPAGAPFERVHVDVEMRVCRKRMRPPRAGSGMSSEDWLVWNRITDKYRPRDIGNVHDACKAALDALQPERVVSRGLELHLIPGAGVVVADDAKHMTLGAPGLVEVDSFANEGVWITVTEVSG